MAQVGAAAEAGHARYTYRLRVSSTARTALAAEWDRCRWVWNECVAKSRAVHLHNKATGQKATCGPAQLDRMLTEARARTPWLREGSSVVQQQVIRDFGRSRAKAHKDIKERLPMARRAGMPKYKKKREALATLNYTRRGFRLKDGRLHLAGGIVVTVVWSRELPAEPSSVRVYQDSLGHWYGSFVVPAQVQPLPRDRPCTRRRLGREGDRDHHVRRARPPPRRARQEGAGEADPVRPDDGPPQAEEGPGPGRRATARRRNCGRRRTRRSPGSVQDTGRKWAKKVVRDHDAIAVEDFRPKFLARTTMARKAADAAIGATKAALIEMGRKHGRDIRLVHPAHTTMDCAHCDARAKHALPLGERTYTCTACGTVSPGTRTPPA